MTAVLTLSVILFGVMAYFQLPVNDLPAVDYPVIQVSVGYPGASPDTIANNIATPLERQFMQINGLEVVTSQSKQGFASLTLQFALDKNLLHSTPPILNLSGNQLLCDFPVFTSSSRCFDRGRFGRQGLDRKIIGLALDLLQRGLDIGVIRKTLEDGFVFENGRGKLAHLHVGLGNALGSGDGFLLAAQFRIRFLEDFQ